MYSVELRRRSSQERGKTNIRTEGALYPELRWIWRSRNLTKHEHFKHHPFWQIIIRLLEKHLADYLTFKFRPRCLNSGLFRKLESLVVIVNPWKVDYPPIKPTQNTGMCDQRSFLNLRVGYFMLWKTDVVYVCIFTRNWPQLRVGVYKPRQRKDFRIAPYNFKTKR